LDFLLPYWNPLIVHPLEWCLRQLAAPLGTVMGPGLAGGVAIVLFTIVLRVALLPLAMLQIRSQKHQLAIQPELRALQRKYKGDREGLAREQMALYKERGVNPMAGCLPMLIQLPILFGMYSAMSQLATQGLTLDQVTTSQVQAGQVVYAAERNQEPLPFNQFVLARVQAVPQGTVTLDIPADQAHVYLHGQELLSGTSGLTLNPGQAPGNPNPPNTSSGKASIFLRAGSLLPDGTYDRSSPVVAGQPITVEIWVDASGTNADAAGATVAYDPALLDVTGIQTPQVEDIAFKSRFLWLPSLGQPDVLAHVGGLSIPGLLLIIMTITSFVSQRMTTLPSDDPQQQAMMRSMAFMPLMYLFFFLNTPAGLVLYWLISNVFSMFQQYFTVGLGLLAGDLERYTGRDFQPSWAHVPTQLAPAAAVVEGAPSGNGRAPRGARTDGTTPGSRARPGSTARPRAGGSKGRKRGKR
jgi:YidC/Oxa1 family membrane protein insertase